MLSIFIQNFGCRVNQAEAFAWAETLQAGGLRLADEWRSAAIIIVNTCTLTGRADRDVNRFLRRMLRERPGARIAITGCSAQTLPQDIRESPQVILSLPNCEKDQLAARLLSLFKGNRLLRPEPGDVSAKVRADPRGPRSSEGLSGRDQDELKWRSHGGEAEDGRLGGEEAYPFRARAYVKIQDGCDARCTFCVIPSVRGRSKSVPVDDVVAKVKALTADGFHEIVLAGIHLSSYGEDLGGAMTGPAGGLWEGEITLTNLLGRIEEVPGLGRLRLSSLDPRKIDDPFIALVAGDPLICQHFHLSLQHASANILRKMGRLDSLDRTQSGGMKKARPTGARKVPSCFETLLGRLRSVSPEAAIGADIIVGFPGETDEDFAVLVAFLERSPLSYFHVFPYSPRRGTPAASWPQVPEAVKSARARRLRHLSAAKNLEFRRSLLGKELEAIVIARALARGDPIKRNDSAELLTGNYIRVSVPNCPASRRDLVRVRITRVLPARTEGSVA